MTKPRTEWRRGAPGNVEAGQARRSQGTADAFPSVVQCVPSLSVSSSTAALAGYVDVVLGERSGFLAVAFGHDPYRDATGRYRHRPWTERRYPWPAGREQLGTDLARVIVAGERADVYVCPAVRFTDDRRKGSALPPAVCWADLDGPSTDPDLFATLEPFTVESGSDGHRHMYVILTRPVDLGMHARLNKALATRLGGDAKWSDESLLRLPGTLNYKTDPPAAVRPLPWSGRVWDPGDLAALLGVDPARPAPGVNGSAPVTALVAAEPLPDPLPALVCGALEHSGTADRSAAHHRLMGACYDAGLSCGQALTLAAGYAPSREKYGDRLAAEVARSWGKIEQGLASGQSPATERMGPTARRARADRPGLHIGSPAVAAEWLRENIGSGHLAGMFNRDDTIVYTPQEGNEGYIPLTEDGLDGPVQIRSVSEDRLAAIIQYTYSCYREKQKTGLLGENGVTVREASMFPRSAARVAVEVPHMLPNLRKLRGVIHSPLVRKDGSILHEPGYDEPHIPLFSLRRDFCDSYGSRNADVYRAWLVCLRDSHCAI